MKQPFILHFISERLQTAEDGPASEEYTSELITKNQILVSKDASDKRTVLLPGNNTVLSEDGHAIVSLITGYPFIENKQNSQLPSAQVHMVPLVHLQPDKMGASLTLYPTPSGKDALTPAELETILLEEGINYGIDQAMLHECTEKLVHLKQIENNIPIARGILPIDGKDAFLRFEMEIGPLPGTILRDGSIDFRERKIFTGVNENQVIAVRVPETKGTPGINVFGEALSQQSGKDINVKVSGDASYSPETGQVIAARAGVLSAVKGTDIKVSAKQLIAGDVDLSVGNIESKNGVDIKGNVLPGFTVKTKGDLRIGGNIQSATIFCQGNVVVNGGLLGTNSRLDSLGDADINFAERTKIIAGGKITLRKGAYYSEITSGDDILCPPDSKIVGCVFCSAGNFIGGDVGSSQGQAATIAVGVDGKRYRKYEELQQQILNIEDTLLTLRARKGEKSTADELYQQYEYELLQVRSSFKKLNLIPKTPAYSRNEPALASSGARITIHGMAAIGTKLRIGNLTRTLVDECFAVQFSVDQKLDQIVVNNL
jgi:uncharacterized protein (DUF342 family)